MPVADEYSEEAALIGRQIDAGTSLTPACKGVPRMLGIAAHLRHHAHQTFSIFDPEAPADWNPGVCGQEADIDAIAGHEVHETIAGGTAPWMAAGRIHGALPAAFEMLTIGNSRLRSSNRLHFNNPIVVQNRRGRVAKTVRHEQVKLAGAERVELLNRQGAAPRRRLTRVDFKPPSAVVVKNNGRERGRKWSGNDSIHLFQITRLTSAHRGVEEGARRNYPRAPFQWEGHRALCGPLTEIA